MNLKKIIVALAMASAVAVPSIALGASSAGASSIPTNFPGNTGTSCNAWHGAPGGFGPNSPYYFVRTDADFGQEQGVITGQNNSSYSATCNS